MCFCLEYISAGYFSYIVAGSCANGTLYSHVQPTVKRILVFAGMPLFKKGQRNKAGRRRTLPSLLNQVPRRNTRAFELFPFPQRKDKIQKEFPLPYPGKICYTKTDA